MPKLFETPMKYTMPTPGDVWQKELNDGEWEHGIVVGVKPRYFTEGPRKGEMSSWTAHITSGFRDYRQDVAWDKTYQITEQWHPAPAEKQIPAAVREMFARVFEGIKVFEERLAVVETAPAALGDAVDKATFLALEKHLLQVVDEHNKNVHALVEVRERFSALEKEVRPQLSLLHSATAGLQQDVDRLTDKPVEFVVREAPKVLAVETGPAAPPERPRRGGVTVTG